MCTAALCNIACGACPVAEGPLHGGPQGTTNCRLPGWRHGEASCHPQVTLTKQYAGSGTVGGSAVVYSYSPTAMAVSPTTNVSTTIMPQTAMISCRCTDCFEGLGF